jgi:hypothetical protein
MSDAKTSKSKSNRRAVFLAAVAAITYSTYRDGGFHGFTKEAALERICADKTPERQHRSYSACRQLQLKKD